ncbi:esterase-like activity of phytase family protein [Temperatibacter marinus]|uniref:Esterase-like activity of phytase family protein n=1 Tax=Temperatibacter marinus TaxID=1456591 RepID=A0AA52HA60_9PROT|nr:esterase-like activity of phytase family protein [Temperatibacter marinus]WND03639.1 esterase-like activity of phytase family protein [Temperatibacter marinus]
MTIKPISRIRIFFRSLLLIIPLSLAGYFLWPAAPLEPLKPVTSQEKTTNNAAYVQSVNQSGKDIAVSVSPWVLNPDNPEQAQFGSLSLNWAKRLETTDPEFGGVSGLSLIEATNQIVSFRSITDTGYVFSLHVSEPRQGDMMSISHFRPVLNRGEEKGDSDSEAVIVMPFGFDLITYERNHRIMVGDIRLKNPPRIDLLPLNGGIESADISPLTKRLTLLAEDPREGEEYIPLWISRMPLDEGRVDLTYDEYKYNSPEGYKPTDITFLPDGSMLILHRRWTPLEGTSAKITHVPVTQLQKPEGSLIQSILLADLSKEMAVDNFEGLEVIEGEGFYTLFIISDDNFRDAQETLLLSFRLDKAILENIKIDP